MLLGRYAVRAGLVQRVHQLAVHVELELLCGAVPGPDRRGALVAGQPVELGLGETPFAGHAVHDLHLLGPAGQRPQQPLAPGAGLVVVAGADQGQQRERGVADPAEPVVPVAHAADLLGQRGRGCGDDAAGRAVDQRLERDQRAQHRVAVGTVIGAPRRPVLPPAGGPVERPAGVQRVGGRLVRGRPGQREVDDVAGGHVELRDGVALSVATPVRDVGVERHRVGAGEHADPPVLVVDPRHVVAVVEADDQLAAHPHRAADPLDPSYQRRVALAERHRVDEAHHAVVGVQLGLQDEGVLAVAALDPARFDGRGDLPPAVVR